MSSEKKDFSVDLSMMSDRSKKLNDELELLKRNTDELATRIEVLRTMWSGDSANAFFDSIYSDLRLAEDFIAASEKARDDHQYALKIYTEIEQRSMDITNAINI